MKMSVRYGLQQFIYFASLAATACYAVTFLLDRGFPATQTGLLLGASSILSCLLQPVLGAVIDRSRRPILIPVLLLVTAITMGSYIVILLTELPLCVFAAVYLFGSLASGCISSLCNSITVYYRSESDPISFSVGRGLASLAYGIFTLIMGYMIVWVGIDWILWMSMVFMGAFFFITTGFLKHKPADREFAEEGEVSSAQSLSLWEFFRKYRLFMATLIGIMCLSMFHSMTESYLIKIMERLGGNSSNQGTALFIATISSVPVFFIIDKIRKYLSIKGMILIAGVCFILKSIMFLLATSVAFIYAAQLLQTVTYAFLAPAQVFHADASVEAADKVKGQTISAAFYTLGYALGNMAGGFLLERVGVGGMLGTGVGMATTGTIILFFALQEKRKPR